MEELEKTQATLAKQDKLYVTCKKALALGRSEVETLHLEVDQAESIIATLKDDLNILQEKNNALKTRNEELREQFSTLWDKTSHLTKASEISNVSTSKGCDKCYNVNLEACATNLANMEVMKKEIARLNNIIASGCMDEASKKPKFIQGRHPFIKDGLGHTKGGKTGKRHMVNGVSCIRFEKRGTIGEVLPVQTTETLSLNAKAPRPGGSMPKHEGSRVWKHSSTNKNKTQPQPRQQAPKASNIRLQVKENPIVPKRNKYAHKPKTHASQ
jgi:regulator of replication initiation timing